MLLLLGLLSLLTAADEVRHADAQHRATSDPSEGHAVETGEREAGALLVDDGEAELTGRYGGRIGLYNTISSSNVGRILVRSHRGAILLKRAASNGKRDTFGSRVVVARRRGYLCKGVGALIETDNVYLTVCVGLQLGLLAISRLGTVRFDKVARISVLLQRELNALEPLCFVIRAHLGDIDAIGVVIGRVLDRGADTLSMRIVGISQLNRISLGLTNQSTKGLLDFTVIIKDLGRVELCLVLDGHLRVAVQCNSSIVHVRAILEIGEVDSYRIVLVLGGVAASLDLGITNLDRDSGRRAVRFKLGVMDVGRLSVKMYL